MIQQTLVLIKPDGVQRQLIGEIIKRFEQRGLKIVGLKLTKVEKDLAKKHYTEDITKRRGEKVRNHLLNFITSGPVVAMVMPTNEELVIAIDTYNIVNNEDFKF